MKFLKFLRNAFLTIFMVVYIVIGARATMTVFHAREVRAHPIGYFSFLVKAAIEQNKPYFISRWVQMRPLEDTDEMIKILTPESGRLSSEVFMGLSYRRLQQGNIEDALFWSQLTRYRLRFDTLRCGTEDPSKLFDVLMEVFTPKKVTALLAAHPELVKKSVQRVIDFDKKYPAENDPTQTCEWLNKLTRQETPILPKEMWPTVRRNLHFVTENSLADMK